MAYYVRPMLKEDVPQVTEIDREAFPTQLPPANYNHELQNHLARYIVACDDSIPAEEVEDKPVKGLSGLLASIKHRFNRTSPTINKEEYSQTDRGRIIGFAGIWMMIDEAHITNIAVRKQYQRCGIGELLLIAIIDLAKELKASFMTLEVRVSNAIAQSLYSKYGFVEVGIRRGYYLDNREDGLLMSTESITSASFQAQLQKLRNELTKKMI